jgi:NAD+ kinase
MKNIGIVSNNESTEATEVAKKIYDYINKKGKGIPPLLIDGDRVSSDYSLPSVSGQNFIDKSDIIISVGGDGTFLRASKYAIRREIPVLGVNAGNLGFLTVVDTCNMYNAINKVLKNEYEIEERMILEGRFFQNKKPVRNTGLPELAINEFAINRSILGKIIRFEIMVNGISIKEFGSDGLIISTPTGSTGYSLSAGGPIVEPKSEILIITPICPHTLLNRSIILNPDNKIEIITSSRNQEDSVSVDGRTIPFKIESNYIFEVKKSKLKLKSITFNRNIFFKVFREKFIERI